MYILIQLGIFVILMLSLGAIAKFFGAHGIIVVFSMGVIVVLSLVIFNGSIDRLLGFVLLFSIVALSGVLYKFFRLKENN